MADWSRKLPSPVEVGRRKLRTLHDLRAHLIKLPKARHDLPGWQNATEAVLAAAEDGDVVNASVAFRLAQMVHRDR